MPFVFYDTETSGTDPKFDQILQFGAIHTDDDLSEIARFETRCRILPWIVPSPKALSVTGIAPARLTDLSLPSHFEMMELINSRLGAWSPATFTGYNSMQFDEPILRQALWQTLHSPWLTVSDGNSRLDLLLLVQAVFALQPSVLKFPTDQSGKITFRLDRLAPKNGFAHSRAHDAMVDAEAALHIARLIQARIPDFWQSIVQRASRSKIANILADNQIFLFVEAFGLPRARLGIPLTVSPSNPAAMLVAALDAHWQDLLSLDDPNLAQAMRESPRPVVTLALNKGPIIFSAEEARLYWGTAANWELAYKNKDLLNANAVQRIRHTWSQSFPVKGETAEKELEETLYDGFAERGDEQAMIEFHRVPWEKRASLARTFQDPRLRRWAQRAVYANALEFLPDDTKEALDGAIGNRLLRSSSQEASWRSIRDALQELAEMGIGNPLYFEIQDYLRSMERDLRRRRSLDVAKRDFQ